MDLPIKTMWCENVLSSQVDGLTKKVNYRGKLSVREQLALNDMWPHRRGLSKQDYKCLTLFQRMGSI